MGLVKVVATRIEKDERVSVRDSYNFCLVHGKNFDATYRVTPISCNKEWLAKAVAAFYEAHNVTPKKIEVVYDAES